MMKRNKAFLRLGSQSIIERVVETLDSLFPQVLIVANATEEYQGLGCQIVSDLLTIPGALTGLFSGLSQSPTHHSFFVACDMPFLQSDVVRYLACQAQGWDVVIPRIAGCYQPLHAIYSKDCLPAIVQQLKEGNQTIFDFFPEVNVKEINEDEIRQIDHDLLSFFNLNTPQDLQRARDIYAQSS